MLIMDGLALLVFAVTLCCGRTSDLCSEDDVKCLEVASPLLCQSVVRPQVGERCFVQNACACMCACLRKCMCVRVCVCVSVCMRKCNV